MNCNDLSVAIRQAHKAKQAGTLDHSHGDTWSRLTTWRIKDMNTHLRSLAAALERESFEKVDASELTDDNIHQVKRFLEGQGKKADVVHNTCGNLKFMQEFAREMGVAIREKPNLERPAKHQVYRREGEVVHKVAPKSAFGHYTRYAFKMPLWPDHLVEEAKPIIRYFTDPTAEHRNDNIFRKSTYNTWLCGLERFFGFLLTQGYTPDQLSFKLATKMDIFKAYRTFLYNRKGCDTFGTKGELERLRQLTLGYYQDQATNDQMSRYIHKSCDFVLVKDKDDLPHRVHVDDLYTVGLSLAAEAQHYEDNIRSKYGRANPDAQMAAHWMKAALWGFMTTTMLRERNLAQATTWHVYKQDGAWHFRFRKGEMKGPRAKGDQVVDLWQGDAFQNLLYFLMDKAEEVRPLLVAKYRMKNPGRPDPEGFFLNEDGGNYTERAIRVFVNSESVRYLGPGKQISPHDVRTIAPSWLFVREGDPILTTLQRYLDHASLVTTERFYLKVKNIFNARLAKLQMDERAKQRQMQERLAALPDRVAGMFEQFLRTLQGTMLDRETLEHLVRDAVAAALKRAG